MRSDSRDALVRRQGLMEASSAVERCLSCGAPRGLAREYCLECGSKLEQAGPPAIHWLWTALATLLLAAGGGAVAAAASRSSGGDSVQTLVATQRLVTIPAVTTPVTRPPKKPATKGGHVTAGRLIPWPGSGYTIVLTTIPTSRGVGIAKKRALAALAAGLRQVGVLVSSSYPGLHPGYFVVFAGVYGTLEEAESALPNARPTFPGAFARLVTR